MTDFSTAMETVARDPLVVILGLLVLGGLAMHFFFKTHPTGRAIARVVALILLTIVLVHADILPYRPLVLTGAPFTDTVHAILKIAWWVGAAWFLVGVLRAVVVFQRSPREAKLIQDLLAGLIYLAALFAIITYVFDLPIRGLLATSGVVAIILGLALQSTLGDVFSGIVLSFSRPYRPGDWVSIDGTTEGRVIEINWRATHILTVKRDLAIVPNSTIAKAKIVNSSSPSGIHGMTVTVRLAADTSAVAGAEILRQAVLNTKLILSSPAPLVTVKSITGDAVGFDIAFFVEELAQSLRAQNDLFDRIGRHLAAAGIALASTQSPPVWPLQTASAETPKSAVERVLDLVAIFTDLSAAERKTLAAKGKPSHFEQGEVVLAAGTILQSLHVIGAGVASTTRVDLEGEIELLRLGPGDHFGEGGLLTGHATGATVRALTPLTLYELAKDDLAPVIEARPEVPQAMCRALARRQAAGELVVSPDIGKSVPPSGAVAWFSDRLHRLFDLAQAE